MKARLVALRGLGEWTADWFLARHLARPHAWPAGDLGCARRWRRSMVTCPTFAAFAARFHPFENLSAHYLLTGLRVVAARHDDPARHREATTDAVRRLWERWQAERRDPPPVGGRELGGERAEIERALDANALFLAEEDGEPVGFVTAWLEDHFARIGDLYVAERGAARGHRRARSSRR